MAKDRLEPCEFYVEMHECKKGRDAMHYGYCQKCDKYIPRRKAKHENLRKQKLNKIKEKEFLFDGNEI